MYAGHSGLTVMSGVDTKKLMTQVVFFTMSAKPEQNCHKKQSYIFFRDLHTPTVGV